MWGISSASSVTKYKEKKSVKSKRKKLVGNIIFWAIIILIWGTNFYLERHDNVRKRNTFLEKPITEMNLTMEQKLADFDYLYNCIITSVPNDTLQEIENRYGISFIERYELYKSMVKATENDLEFFCVMDSILEDIPSFHTDISYPDYEYYQGFGCWNIDAVLDTRYIKTKAQFWKDTLKENAVQVVQNDLLLYLFWYRNGEYITEDGIMLLEVNGIPAIEMYDRSAVSRMGYDDINSQPYRNWMAFYKAPYSQGLSEEVKIKYQNEDGQIQEAIVYVDNVAMVLTNYAEALGVEEKGTHYVRDNTFYSYEDEEKDILYLYLKSIDSMTMESAADIIRIADCENIILDIRRNSGGVFEAVERYLYPALYGENIEEEYIWYMPKTKYTDKMTKEWRAKKELDLKKSDYYTIGVDGEVQKYKEATKKISLIGGKNDKNYSVYVLTSWRTGSAADTLANILKENDLATLVGNNTGGEGLMKSYLVDYLPESGIVFTYMPELAFNEEGKNNGVYGTSPHYYVAETSPNMEEYEALGEDPYVYKNRLEWDNVLNETIKIIMNVGSE